MCGRGSIWSEEGGRVKWHLHQLPQTASLWRWEGHIHARQSGWRYVEHTRNMRRLQYICTNLTCNKQFALDGRFDYTWHFNQGPSSETVWGPIVIQGITIKSIQFNSIQTTLFIPKENQFSRPSRPYKFPYYCTYIHTSTQCYLCQWQHAGALLCLPQRLQDR